MAAGRWVGPNRRHGLQAPAGPRGPPPRPRSREQPPDTAITADPLPRLRRAEAVLQRRTRRFLVVLEDCLDPHNVAAILRTCEGLGVQHVWIIGDDAVHSSTSVTMGADRWLTVRRFTTTADCVAALREAGRALWVTALSPTAACLGVDPLPIPSSVAVVFGREIDGASDAMLAAADRLVYLPMHGFAESFNVGIAAALVLQRLLSLCPEAEGDLPEEERHALRQKWYPALLRGRSGVDLEPFLARPPSPLPDLRRGTSWHYAKVGRLARRTEDLPPPPADPTDCVAKESLQSPCSPNAS
jgi:tRNA (guanosine-2'-O-)-methyltransferase